MKYIKVILPVIKNYTNLYIRYSVIFMYIQMDELWFVQRNCTIQNIHFSVRCLFLILIYWSHSFTDYASALLRRKSDKMVKGWVRDLMASLHLGRSHVLTRENSPWLILQWKIHRKFQESIEDTSVLIGRRGTGFEG